MPTPLPQFPGENAPPWEGWEPNRPWRCGHLGEGWWEAVEEPAEQLPVAFPMCACVPAAQEHARPRQPLQPHHAAAHAAGQPRGPARRPACQRGCRSRHAPAACRRLRQEEQAAPVGSTVSAAAPTPPCRCAGRGGAC